MEQVINPAKEILIADYECSNRVEDGQLVQAAAVQIQELDCEGRYTVGTYGTYPVDPKYFKVEVNEGHDGKHYLWHRLNDEGWKWVEEELKIKHPGRGWVSINFLTPKQLQEKYEASKAALHNAEMAFTHLTNCLSK